MSKRSQLNINIDPDLLILIKQCALKSGMTVGDFINNIIKSYLTDEDLKKSNLNNNQRLNNIEKRLSDITKSINQLLDVKSESNFIQCTEDDAKNYCILLAKQFKLYARNKMISTKEAWIEFMMQDDAKKILQKHIPIIQDTLREESVCSLNELIEIIKEYSYCPVIPVYHSMTNGELLPELKNLSDKLVASAYC